MDRNESMSVAHHGILNFNITKPSSVSHVTINMGTKLSGSKQPYIQLTGKQEPASKGAGKHVSQSVRHFPDAVTAIHWLIRVGARRTPFEGFTIRQWVPTLRYSAMWHPVVSMISTGISEEPAAAVSREDDGGSMPFRNVGTCFPHYTVDIFKKNAILIRPIWWFVLDDPAAVCNSTVTNRAKTSILF
jgi:hypothetical protein